MTRGPLFPNVSPFLSEELDRNRPKVNTVASGAGWPAVLQSWQDSLRLVLPRTGTIKRGIVGWAFPASLGCQFSDFINKALLLPLPKMFMKEIQEGRKIKPALARPFWLYLWFMR